MRYFHARRASVFDVIAKRRWFYLVSLIITIPGLVFILLTPFTGYAVPLIGVILTALVAVKLVLRSRQAA